LQGPLNHKGTHGPARRDSAALPARRPVPPRLSPLDLYEAVGTRDSVTFEGITVPSRPSRTSVERQEVRAWLWRVLLAEGIRTLTTTSRWSEALAHIERHHGVGARMPDGRQVVVVAALTEGDAERASVSCR